MLEGPELVCFSPEERPVLTSDYEKEGMQLHTAGGQCCRGTSLIGRPKSKTSSELQISIVTMLL